MIHIALAAQAVLRRPNHAAHDDMLYGVPSMPSILVFGWRLAMSRKWIPGAAIAASLAALALGIAAPTTALAHFVKAPCDFITSGGFVFKDDGKDVNFGAHGGCKNDDFWGHVNIVDHETNWHLSSTQIAAYLFDPAQPDARDICGLAETNDGITVRFRVHVVDNVEPGSSDTFGIIDINRQQRPGD